MFRYAPPAHAPLTLADLRIALFNYLASRREGARFVLCFEEPGHESEVLEALGLCGIVGEGVHYRRDNLRIHQHMAVKLLQERKAFACFCDPERLAERQKEAERAGRSYRYDGGCERLSDAEVLDNPNPFTVRLRRPDAPVTVEDELWGMRRVTPEEMDCVVIMERDKRASKPFAEAVDDMLLDISLIVAPLEEMEDSAIQEHIRRALGYDRGVRYAHIEPGEGESEVTVRSLFEAGFLPEALIRYLLATGYDKENSFHRVDETAKAFLVKKISPRAEKFDVSFLRRLNQEEIARMDAKELSRVFGFADSAVGEVAKAFLPWCETLEELKPRVAAVFGPKPLNDADVYRLSRLVASADQTDSFARLSDYLTQKTGLEDEALQKPLRRLLTGQDEGPELETLYPHLQSYLKEIIK